ncbi:MAG: hypothetical protein ACOX0X_02125 [Candidatus Dojkabacteria bacterium]
MEDLNQKFNFIIVGNSTGKNKFIQELFNEANIQPTMIVKGEHWLRTISSVLKTYKERKLPVIFLDEKFGGDQLDTGSSIYATLIGRTDDKGGILFPISPFRELQLEKWAEEDEKYKREEQGKWYIAKELDPFLGNLTIENIKEVCNTYLEGENEYRLEIEKE